MNKSIKRAIYSAAFGLGLVVFGLYGRYFIQADSAANLNSTLVNTSIVAVIVGMVFILISGVLFIIAGNVSK